MIVDSYLHHFAVVDPGNLKGGFGSFSKRARKNLKTMPIFVTMPII